MATEIVSADYLRGILAYNADTGVFTRLISASSNAKAGDVAGSKNSEGYLVIRVLGRLHKAHRLAWVHANGTWPVGQIDHIDGIRDNNALANLRDVSHSVNAQNVRRATSNSTHGFMGATRSGKRWTAQIRVDGKSCHIGSYDTAEEASAAYVKAKRLMHPGSVI